MQMSNNLAACIDGGREARVRLDRHAVLTESDGCTVNVIVIDVSQHGFRLQSSSDLDIGEQVMLQVDGSPGVRGQIRWTCGHQAGGIFLDPISL
jgi:hypothetical protein